MGALKNVWNSPHLDIWSKYLLFCAIPMNLLLWGCETWSMRKALANKLEVFYIIISDAFFECQLRECVRSESEMNMYGICFATYLVCPT